MKKEMLINVLQPEEIRIAILEDGLLEELYVERTSHESYVGNIYKGRIVNIEPSIQAAFVDFGVGRNGFLHVSDVEPAYYRHLEDGDNGRRGARDRGRGGDRDRGERDRGERGGRRQRPPIDRPYEPEPPPARPSLPPDFDEELPLATRPHGADFDPDRYADPAIQDETPFEEGLKDWPGDEAQDSPPAAQIMRPEEISLIGDFAPVAEPATEPRAPSDKDDGQRKGRRRGRGRGRRGRGDNTARPSPTGQPQVTDDRPAESQSDEPPSSADSGEAAPPREWPRFMESAEHRTREDDEPREPLERRPVSDEDLSFSMAPPAGDEPPTRQQEAPWSRDTDVPAERLEEEFVPVEAPATIADFEEPHPSTLDDEALPEYAPELEEDAAPRRRPPRDFDKRDDRRGGRRDNRRDDNRRDDRRGGPRRFPGRMAIGRPKPLIQDIFKRGQEVLVQVIKEGIGTKGPTLSTYISIAGRYLVLMPGLQRIGVSRKIVDEESRRRLREILHELEPPKGIGFIIRTAGIDRNKKELQRDLAYLSRLWEVVVRRIQKMKSPAEIYQESDMITRTIRDIFTGEIDTIWVDEKNAYEHAKEFLQIVMPRYASRIKFYDSTEPMFHRYGIENEIARIHQRHVPLPAGGSVVIDQTEALVAIDVNSGNFRADNNAEETAYQMNLQAAKEIARQLRLRDLGGVIVNDFIDMRDEKHRRGVEKALRDAIRRDRARTKILKISQFGIIEMTRQRIRPSLKRSVFQDCPHCHGAGQVKTCESVSIEVMRLVQLAAHRDIIQRIEVCVQDEVAAYLLNRKRKEIAQLEETGKQITVRGKPGEAPECLEFMCYDNNGSEVKFLPPEPPPTRQGRGRR